MEIKNGNPTDREFIRLEIENCLPKLYPLVKRLQSGEQTDELKKEFQVLRKSVQNLTDWEMFCSSDENNNPYDFDRQLLNVFKDLIGIKSTNDDMELVNRDYYSDFNIRKEDGDLFFYLRKLYFIFECLACNQIFYLTFLDCLDVCSEAESYPGEFDIGWIKKFLLTYLDKELTVSFAGQRENVEYEAVALRDNQNIKSISDLCLVYQNMGELEYLKKLLTEKFKQMIKEEKNKEKNKEKMLEQYQKIKSIIDFTYPPVEDQLHAEEVRIKNQRQIKIKKYKTEFDALVERLRTGEQTDELKKEFKKLQEKAKNLKISWADFSDADEQYFIPYQFDENLFNFFQDIFQDFLGIKSVDGRYKEVRGSYCSRIKFREKDGDLFANLKKLYFIYECLRSNHDFYFSFANGLNLKIEPKDFPKEFDADWIKINLLIGFTYSVFENNSKEVPGSTGDIGEKKNKKVEIILPKNDVILPFEFSASKKTIIHGGLFFCSLAGGGVVTLVSVFGSTILPPVFIVAVVVGGIFTIVCSIALLAPYASQLFGQDNLSYGFNILKMPRNNELDYSLIKFTPREQHAK